MSIQYVCSWCGVLTTHQGIDTIDSGTVLTCSEPGCQADTVIDLSTPAERSRAFALIAKAAVDARSIQAQLEEWAALLNLTDFIRLGHGTAIVSHLGSVTRRGFPRVAAFIHQRLLKA